MSKIQRSSIRWGGNWGRADYAFGRDIASPSVSDMLSLRFLLLVLVALGMLIFGFWRLIHGFRQIKQFIQNNKSKKGR